MTIEHLALVDDITRLDVGNIILLVDFDASDYHEDDHRGWCHDVCRVTGVHPGTEHKVPFILVQTLEREARGGPADEELCIGQYSPGTPPYLDFGGGGLFNCGILFLSTASPAW